MKQGEFVKKPPAKMWRLGKMKLTAWENQDDQGRPWHSFTLVRTYEDGQGAAHTAHSMGVNDLLDAAELLRLGRLWSGGAIGS